MGNFISKAFDKVGDAIESGATSIFKKVVSNVAAKTEKKAEITPGTLVKRALQIGEDSGVFDSFAGGVKDIAKNAAISVATLGVGSAISAGVAAAGAAGSGASGVATLASGLSSGAAKAVTHAPSMATQANTCISSAGQLANIVKGGAAIASVIKVLGSDTKASGLPPILPPSNQTIKDENMSLTGVLQNAVNLYTGLNVGQPQPAAGKDVNVPTSQAGTGIYQGLVNLASGLLDKTKSPVVQTSVATAVGGSKPITGTLPGGVVISIPDSNPGGVTDTKPKNTATSESNSFIAVFTILAISYFILKLLRIVK